MHCICSQHCRSSVKHRGGDYKYIRMHLFLNVMTTDSSSKVGCSGGRLKHVHCLPICLLNIGRRISSKYRFHDVWNKQQLLLNIRAAV